IYGIDVSRWQTTVDWALLKSQGIQFVFIKATQGNYSVDSLLKKHVDGANSAGMIVGLYHWVDPLVDATSQARYFVNNIQ
ncbi:glycoside hydrolase family 25 protein, partial [Escherichia coli]|uniref:glycoside hydrolase family 25 protein n=1 Tax=Escherichia coli TaxID=562 RepID=UPI00321B4554